MTVSDNYDNAIPPNSLTNNDINVWLPTANGKFEQFASKIILYAGALQLENKANSPQAALKIVPNIRNYTDHQMLDFANDVLVNGFSNRFGSTDGLVPYKSALLCNPSKSKFECVSVFKVRRFESGDRDAFLEELPDVNTLSIERVSRGYDHKDMYEHPDVLRHVMSDLKDFISDGNSNLKVPSVRDILSKLTKEDIALLMKDDNLMALKQLSENPEMRRKTLENLKLSLAMANQAVKDGFANRPQVKEEIEEIRTEIIARRYDYYKNKNRGGAYSCCFNYITAAEVKFYYEQPGNKEKFEKFFNRKVEAAKKDGRLEVNQTPTPEEISLAREFYAKSRIYEEEAKEKTAELGAEYNRVVELKFKLQEASYLARIYSEQVLKKKIEITDVEIQNYVRQYPEFDTSAQKNRAYKLFQRAKSGEDFAILAREFSEDPNSKENGGFYGDVRKGQFIPEFENIALSLNPGQIASKLVETKYGYHIIKLEKKGVSTYDVRHILISTMITDPQNPSMPPIPVKDMIKSRLEEEKKRKVLNEIFTNNPINIPDDFEIPKFTSEQLHRLKEIEALQLKQMQQMQNMQNPSKPAPKTKKTNKKRRKT